MKELIQVIDHNFNLHAKKVIEWTEGMSVVQTPNLTYTDSNLSCDTFNIIHIQNGQELGTTELVDAVCYFKSRQLAYCIWVNEENLCEPVKEQLAKVGATRQNEEIGMVLDLHTYDLVERDKHQDIKIVDDSKSLTEFARVIAENWTPADPNVLHYYQLTSHHYLDDANGILLLIGFQDDQPVATAEMFPTDEKVMGCYGIATLETYRRKGLGTAMLTYALNTAKELGYEKAVLQASADGIGIYRKFGFRAYTTYFEYA